MSHRTADQLLLALVPHLVPVARPVLALNNVPLAPRDLLDLVECLRVRVCPPRLEACLKCAGHKVLEDHQDQVALHLIPATQEHNNSLRAQEDLVALAARRLTRAIQGLSNILLVTLAQALIPEAHRLLDTIQGQWAASALLVLEVLADQYTTQGILGQVTSIDPHQVQVVRDRLHPHSSDACNRLTTWYSAGAELVFTPI
jgi:hypothetical protein